ncbi:MAG TPA: hypothetical protein VGL61_13975 [Kofleriaceae bacterium]
MRWIPVVIAMAGCGRIGFDELGDGGGNAGDGTCASVGGSLSGSTCVITTDGGPVTCPAGLTCQIDCNSPTACNAGIDCSNAAACEIDCNVAGSCTSGETTCHGDCDLFCHASNTCDGVTVDCAESGCAIWCCPDTSFCGNDNDGNFSTSGSACT